MIEVSRVCIIYGTACNINCKYCFRKGYSDFTVPTDISDDFRNYLSNLKPDTCDAVNCNGGEPLLYLPKIKEVFSIVPQEVHKLIMSNCTLLNQDIVNWVNDNNIEIHLSNDGANTEFLRGVNVLENDRLLNLIKQIKLLRIVCVVTSLNNSIKDNYNYYVKKLGRENIMVSFSAMQEFPFNSYLIKNFDYDLYYKELAWFAKNKYRRTPYHFKIPTYKRLTGLHFDLHGNVRSVSSGRIVGTIHNTLDEVLANLDKTEDAMYCNNADCTLKGHCFIPKQNATPHTCKCAQISGDIYNE